MVRKSKRRNTRHGEGQGAHPLPRPRPEARERALEVVLKADTAGTCEAVKGLLERLSKAGREVRVIRSAPGEVTKNDVLLAATAGKLVVGFQVGVSPKVEEAARTMGVEILTSDVVHELEAAVLKRVQSPRKKDAGEEDLVGQGRIIGCEITQGRFVVGRPFRVISAMGPVYEGMIQSMQMDRRPVQEAGVGAQVGIKIADWNRAREGDLVEVFTRRR
ncbi:translation initiation factor IF-2 [Desulfacinum infernum DSM 9756]|uniref:Translation initiation factor IF-2 n=1 Tax=Desulfacinum infernum DSM 9756 TaxID=1121391 RepID=A0A1M4TFY8_9BACT|nr:hypothetical protein [Desulfacinum infernum]SHE43207.1 translation initiation factor IF-2 [Desulfacinum infernum DSM 9756]